MESEDEWNESSKDVKDSSSSLTTMSAAEEAVNDGSKASSEASVSPLGMSGISWKLSSVDRKEVVEVDEE